jgi:gas vesicle protein
MNGQHCAGFGLGLLVGAMIGGAIALLYAPRTGKDTRAMIAGKISNVAQSVGETVGTVRHAVGEKIAGEECS